MSKSTSSRTARAAKRARGVHGRPGDAGFELFRAWFAAVGQAVELIAAKDVLP